MPELLVDTSAWVDLLLGRRPMPEGHVGSEIAACTLAAAELASLGQQGRIPSELLGRLLVEARLEECSLADMVDGGLFHGRLRLEGNDKVSLIDCVMYSAARRLGVPFLTSDSDLVGQPGVIHL